MGEEYRWVRKRVKQMGEGAGCSGPILRSRVNRRGVPWYITDLRGAEEGPFPLFTNRAPCRRNSS